MNRIFVALLACIALFGCRNDRAERATETSWSTLDGAWEFRSTTDSGWLPATVPGTVHTDLMATGRLPDPYRSTYEDSVQWVEHLDWTYRRQFTVTDAQLANAHVDLVFEGLDTYATIRLNGNHIGQADNMHRTWAFPVKHLLRQGVNDVEVTFRSPVARGGELLAVYGRSLPADNDMGTPAVSPFVRKAGIHFGWDFAPRLVTSGIWQRTGIRAWSGVRIAHVTLVQEGRGGLRQLRITVHTEGHADNAMQAAIRLGGRPLQGEWERLADGLRFSTSIPDTGRWWPHTMGEPMLHLLEVELIQAGHASRWEGLVGLRDIALDQRPDSMGTPFRFVVNGSPMFAQGANLVPPDMFLPRAGDAGWLSCVRHLKDLGANMVRVWGGGVYPPDAFFEACDSAGILVWQDLMFANTMVPDDSAFTANVEAEVRGQVLRLQHHACLAHWCGNNEIDVAWHNWGWQDTYAITAPDSARMWRSYVALFRERLPRLIGQLDPGRPYSSTSPLSNWGNPEGLRHGSLHYWGVWHGDEPFASFRTNVGRFVSEYGSQSYPAWETLEQWAAPEDLAPGSAFWALRQKSYKGDAAIALQARLHGLPVRDRRELVETSRQLQAMAYRTAIEAHQRAPWCAGTLLWQLNEPWPGASWSLVEYGGRVKPAYQAVREAYRSRLTEGSQGSDRP